MSTTQIRSKVMTELELYNKLRQEMSLVSVLPTLYSAQLQRSKPEKVSRDDILSKLTHLTGSNGWCQYSDSYHTGALIIDKTNIIEGEWYEGGQTVKVQLLHDEEYLITTMKKIKVSDQSLNVDYYQQQAIINRHDSKDVTLTDSYYIWWGCVDGRYQPLGQQYLGTSTKNNNSEKSS